MPQLKTRPLPEIDFPAKDIVLDSPMSYAPFADKDERQIREAYLRRERKRAAADRSEVD